MHAHGGTKRCTFLDFGRYVESQECFDGGQAIDYIG